MEHKDYSGAIRWQVDHDVPLAITTQLFGKSEASIPVIVWRNSNRLIPRKVELVLSSVESAGLSADRLLKKLHIEEVGIEEDGPTKLDQQIDKFGRHFWEKVRDHRGTVELGRLLRKVSRPSWDNIPLRRSAAKLYHLLAEIYLHAGCCRSSLKFGVKAYMAEEQLYKELLSKDELFSIGKTCLLISQALINRSEYEAALPWVKRSKIAFAAGSHAIDPEHYKQLGTIQFHGGAMIEARKNYQMAGNLLGDYKTGVTEAEVRDIGERHVYLVDEQPNWEEAFNLMKWSLRHWPEDDIHQALNVNWAAAAALMSGSKTGTKQAIDLLHEKAHLSNGYLHPQTVTELLLMTSELPEKLRAEWVRFSLHYNAFRNK